MERLHVADHLELQVERHEETPLACARGNPEGLVLASMPGMDTDLDTLSEEWAQRDALECELLELERAIGQQRRLHLAALAGGAEPQAAELEASIDSLLTRLAAVNAELAALCGAAASGRA